jgi:polyisoprenoid-binding protein YceI
VKSVSGTLTLLGKTQPVTLNADQYGCYDHPRLKVQVCAGDFSTTIKRSQWGMGYAGHPARRGAPGDPGRGRQAALRA